MFYLGGGATNQISGLNQDSWKEDGRIQRRKKTRMETDEKKLFRMTAINTLKLPFMYIKLKV